MIEWIVVFENSIFRLEVAADNTRMRGTCRCCGCLIYHRSVDAIGLEGIADESTIRAHYADRHMLVEVS